MQKNLISFTLKQHVLRARCVFKQNTAHFIFLKLSQNVQRREGAIHREGGIYANLT